MNLSIQNLKHIHLIAICGTGMGSLAGMLKSKGYQVTGSDQAVYPPMSEQLAHQGIAVWEGYSPKHLEPKPDLVVIGNAISQGNPEGDAVLELGIPYMSMTEALRTFFFADRTAIAVCGTHGKTTATALLAWTLELAGKEPTYLVGGVLENTGLSFHVGQGPLAVVEGDEYDNAWFDKVPKFIRYRPDIAIINNIEFDHADIYPDFEAVLSAFRRLIQELPPTGLLVAGIDCPHVRELLDLAPCRTITYGLDRTADFTAVIDDLDLQRMTFTYSKRGRKQKSYKTSLIGRHNLKNLLGVIALAGELSLSPQEIKAGLTSFRGVKRRQQVRGKVDDILVIDDFAHHPTAVAVTLEALKMAQPRRRLVAVFEPRSNTSRRNIFQQSYALSFGAADLIVICEVFLKGGAMPADKLDVAALVEALNRQGKEAFYATDYAAVIALLSTILKPHDQVAFLSNGAFGNLPVRALNMLQEREPT